MIGMIGTAISVIIGLVASNFIWEAALGKKDWSRACEISWFQMVAIAIFIWLCR